MCERVNSVYSMNSMNTVNAMNSSVHVHFCYPVDTLPYKRIYDAVYDEARQ
jgi:hypothetical protein